MCESPVWLPLEALVTALGDLQCLEAQGISQKPETGPRWEGASLFLTQGIKIPHTQEGSGLSLTTTQGLLHLLWERGPAESRAQRPPPLLTPMEGLGAPRSPWIFSWRLPGLTEAL